MPCWYTYSIKGWTRQIELAEESGYCAGWLILFQINQDAKKRYLDKLHFTGGVGPYETEKKEWKDDVDMRPSITQINVRMYLLVSPSPYTGADLLNKLLLQTCNSNRLLLQTCWTSWLLKKISRCMGERNIGDVCVWWQWNWEESTLC